MRRRVPRWLGLLLVLLAVGLLWNTWLVWPLKILVVFFHEMGHGLAAVLTGGRIVEIRLEAA
ncbi:MAG: M50 family metallopeptidase, partial [Planctomycetota bacterium]